MRSVPLQFRDDDGNRDLIEEALELFALKRISQIWRRKQFVHLAGLIVIGNHGVYINLTKAVRPALNKTGMVRRSRHSNQEMNGFTSPSATRDASDQGSHSRARCLAQESHG